MSPVNPFGVGVEEASQELLGALGWHALVEFAVSKYSSTPQMVKETNLFFAAHSLLRLFADAPTVVLTRSPLGVVSSFRRSDLFLVGGTTTATGR